MTDDLLSKLVSYMKNQIVKCQYVLDGNLQDIPIYSKEINNSVLKINILLDKDVEGKITEFKFFDDQGQIMKEENCNIVKTRGKSLFKIFNISISEVI